MLNQNNHESENQILLARALTRYIRESYTLSDRAKSLCSPRDFDDKHWAFFQEMGLFGLPFSEANGGYGGTLSDVISVMRIVGEGLILEPYYQCILVAGKLLEAISDSEQRFSLLAQLIAGERLFGLAHWERGDGETTIQLGNDGAVLTGKKFLVPVADSLATLLVSARDERGALQVCAVSMTAPGVTARPYRSIDGHRLSDIQFDHVYVDKADILRFDDAQASIDRVLQYAAVALSAESLGCMTALLNMTVDYVKTRKQFGREIGSFQVIKHRLVDCYTAVQQSECLLALAADDTHPMWRSRVFAARAFVCDKARELGHEAIQMHGGMGMTDELAVSHYHKRIIAINALLADRQTCIANFVNTPAYLNPEEDQISPFKDYLDERDEQFQSEVREFMDLQLTDTLRNAVRRQVNAFTEPEITGEWQQRVAKKGWLAPHWPSELGGAGWRPLQRFIFEYESGVAGAPDLIPMGLRYVGPVISHFGSDWQKAFFLPKILSGEHYWAQGFSEPSAGSDLAALKTSAVLDGDHYVINGSKIWTTHAHFANWLFCLARTDKEVKPQQGIGFFLIDLNSPGIRIEEIRLMAGPREVNQVFFDDVRVPVANLVGDPCRGWEYTKFLLEFERGGAVFCGRARSELNLAKELIVRLVRPMDVNSVLASRLASMEFRLMALELQEFRHAQAMEAGGAPGVGASVTKLLASELRKDINELAMDLVGSAGLEYQPEFLLDGSEVPGFVGIDLELSALSRYLGMRAESIYGGASEVQRDIIARQLLGLR